MGVENPISVRLYSAENSMGTLFDRLEQRMKLLEAEGSDHFIPRSKSLADPKRGCISVGINGAASNACTGFEVRT
jgi:hypothetical protein